MGIGVDELIARAEITDVAQVDTYCVAHHIRHPDADGTSTDMVLGLRYVDRFERRDGTWSIARRVCAFDWVITVPFDQRDSPLQGEAGAFFPADFTVGARDRSDITYRGV